MSSISVTTRDQIQAYLEGFITGFLDPHDTSDVEKSEFPQIDSSESGKGLNPFSQALLPQNIIKSSTYVRCFSRGLESTFEECARLIALDHHAEVTRSYDVQAKVSQAGINEIGRQVETFEHAAEAGQSRPLLKDMIQAVFDANREDDLHSLRIRADLYIRTHQGTNLFFEMKSPVPNKGQCVEVTQRILRFHLLTGQPRPKTQSFFAMAYNPYGHQRDSYTWSITKLYTPFEHGVLIGPEFWDIVGGPTTYEELLEIYQEAGKAKSKYMIDALAFGF